MKGVSLSRTLNICRLSIHIFLSKYGWNEQRWRKESPCPSAKLQQDELANITLVDRAVAIETEDVKNVQVT